MAAALFLALWTAVATAQPADPPWQIADAARRALVRVWVPANAEAVQRPIALSVPDAAALPPGSTFRAWDLTADREVAVQPAGAAVLLDPGAALAPGSEHRYFLYVSPAPAATPAVAQVDGAFRIETDRYVALLDRDRGGAITSLQLKDGDRLTETLGDGIHWWIGRDPKQVAQKKLGALPTEQTSAGPVFVGFRVTTPDLLTAGNSMVTEYRFFRDFIEIDHHYNAKTSTQLLWLKMPVSLRATGQTPGLFSNSQTQDGAMQVAGNTGRWTPDPAWHDVSYTGDAPFGLGVILRNTLPGGGLYYMDSVKPDEREWIYVEPYGWEKPVEIQADFDVKLTVVPHAAGPGRYADTLAKLAHDVGTSVSVFQAKDAPAPDSDNDGLPDLAELELTTNPNLPDTDLDGIPDGQDPEPLQGPTPTFGLVLPDSPAQPTDQPQTIARVTPVQGVPTLVLDGRPYGPMIYTRCAGSYEQIAQIADRDFPVHFEMVGGIGWPGAQLDTFRRLDDRINQFLDEVPNARIILRLYVCNPPHFARDYPDEVMTFNDGTTQHYTKWYAMTDRPPEERGYPSFASEQWRQKTAEALAGYVAHVRQADYARNVIGYFICGGGTEEWYYWGDYDHNLYCVDYSKPMLNAFRTYLRAKYDGDARKLRQAWGAPKIDFASALPPDPVRRRTLDTGAFWDPERSQQVRDYYYVHNKVMEDSVRLFAHAVKQACKGEQLVGIFHGYLQNHWLLEGGQATLKDVLASPDVDFWSGPPQYNRRGHGEHGCNRFLLGSLKKHGKLWISESDIRTNFSEMSDKNPSLYGRPPDLEESLACLTREYAHQLCEGGNGWWFQMGKSWYHHEPILAQFQKMQLNGEAAMGLDRTSDTDIAAVVDLDSLFTTGPWPVSSSLLDAFKVQELCRLGAPVDHYELDDILAPDAKRYKLCIMLNCFSLTDAKRRLIDERLRRDGATLVWMFAPGLFNPDQKPEMSPDHSRDLLGFGLDSERGDRLKLDMKLTDAGQQLFTGFDPQRVFGSFERPEWVLDPKTGGVREQKPGGTTLPQRFSGVADDASVLARFEDGGKPAIVLRQAPAATDVWIGSVMAPADLLRALARRAGCHLFCDADEIIYANHSFLAIHTRTAGPRTFNLRRQSDVVEIFSGQVLGQGVTQFQDSIDAFRTRVYFLGDRAQWEKETARARAFFDGFQTELKAQRLVRAARPKKSAVPSAKPLTETGPFKLTPDGFARTFLFCGPFPSPNTGGATVGFAQDFIGEAAARPTVGQTCATVFKALEGTPEATEWFGGKADEKALTNAWQALEVSEDLPRLKEQLPDIFADQLVAYYVAVYAEVKAPTPAEIRLGSDDGFKLWLNGEPVGGQNASRGVGIDTDRFTVEFKPGRNLILLKVIQGGGPSGWCLRLTDAQGRPLQNVDLWLGDSVTP
ncbi:MAG: hypothetical protein A3K19_17835 [Lentisphaerae bacterium RIFOXYB12_FULL_65_16]|nr:MAG: hypothetical protein A3K18_16180 [Lentisphaerae bacterium RIFOXYA12_64_32]OGV85310.1 MAG: hypothetical protein A3K19_17835 [Lentisphaerae bacterium RIFOXYB12_FULL_65_16]